MIRLDTVNRTIVMALSGATTTNLVQVSCSYSDKTSTAYVGATSLSTLSTTASVTAISAPASGNIRDVDYISVYNKDTVAATVTISLNDTGTLTNYCIVILAAGDHLSYTHGAGWTTQDSTGAAKANALANWNSPGTIGFTTPNSGAFTTLSATGQITSTLTGVLPPLSIASSVNVPNLNVSQLLGNTWSVPASIGATTPNAGAFTTLSATGQITSTLASGTSPLAITSTTVVPNLNVSQLLGSTWAIPASIGETTPNVGAFTNISSSGAVSGTGFTTLISNSLASPPVIGSTTPNAGQFSSIVCPLYQTQSLSTGGNPSTLVISAGSDTSLVGANAGALNFSGGNSTNGYGGGVTISSGTGASGNGNVVITSNNTLALAAPNGATLNGALTISGGLTVTSSSAISFTINNLSGAGSAYSVTAGNGTTSNSGGAINLTAGNGGSASTYGLGGVVNITGGISYLAQSGNSGGVVIKGGAAGRTAIVGAAVSISGGAGWATTTGGAGGAASLLGGAGGLLAAGGVTTVSGGAGGATGKGGATVITSGIPGTSATGGTGTSGAISIQPGYPLGVNQSGGAVTVAGGSATGSGTIGSLYLNGSGSYLNFTINAVTLTASGVINMASSGVFTLTTQDTGATTAPIYITSASLGQTQASNSSGNVYINTGSDSTGQTGFPNTIGSILIDTGSVGATGSTNGVITIGAANASTVNIGTATNTVFVKGVVRTGGFTVATLPTGAVGMRTYVTNALAPTFGATVAAGGAVVIPVFYNGTNWIVG